MCQKLQKTYGEESEVSEQQSDEHEQSRLTPEGEKIFERIIRLSSTSEPTPARDPMSVGSILNLLRETLSEQLRKINPDGKKKSQ